MSDHFEPSLDDLIDTLPGWWAAANPASELHKFLDGLGVMLDRLCQAAETILADQALETATLDGLQNEWAPLYGAASERLPSTTDALRGYLQVRAADDGSTESLIEALLALLRIPANDVGVELVFPADGSGLLFPADGSGLSVYEDIPERAELAFPLDGSGLTFPGSGLIFPQAARIEVIERPADHVFEVHVKKGLAYDHDALARAVERYRMIDQLPPIVVEVY